MLYASEIKKSANNLMSVQVYGCNHVVIEVDDVEKATAFYQDVFNLEKLDEGEGDAFFKLGEHQFLAVRGRGTKARPYAPFWTNCAR